MPYLDEIKCSLDSLFNTRYLSEFSLSTAYICIYKYNLKHASLQTEFSVYIKKTPALNAGV